MNNVIPLRPHDPLPQPLPPANRRQALTILLAAQGKVGLTWIDVASHLGLHHGAASGLLSNQHKAGRIDRLIEKRDDCSIYVLPEYVAGRRTVPYKVNQQALVDNMATLLRRFHRPCRKHSFPDERCRQCEVGMLLAQYDQLRSSH